MQSYVIMVKCYQRNIFPILIKLLINFGVGIIKQSDLPKEVTDILGFNNKSMINRLIGDLVIHSYELPYLQFSNEVFESLKCLLNFLTIKVHQHPVLVKENAKLIRMIKQLYDIYYEELTDLENEKKNV